MEPRIQETSGADQNNERVRMDPDEVGRLAVRGLVVLQPGHEARYKELLAAFDAQAPRG